MMICLITTFLHMSMSFVVKEIEEKKKHYWFSFKIKHNMDSLFSFFLYYSPKYPYYSRIFPLCYYMSMIPEKMLT